MEGKLKKNQQNKLFKKFFEKQESPGKLEVKETKQHRQCVQIYRKANSIIQSKPPLKKYFGLNKHFESHFNAGHTKIKMPSKTEKKT